NKSKTIEDYNLIILVELSDKNLHLMAYNTIYCLMIHGLCGSAYSNASCMQNGKCTKKHH
ncbi:23565_t:CDS:1, partial [Cetraspora pellucida]